jgi:hypothetical protein
VLVVWVITLLELFLVETEEGETAQLVAVVVVQMGETVRTTQEVEGLEVAL